MTTYVLVPGVWLGGWAWDAVAVRLRQRGHVVLPVTLPGLGDRAGLATPATDLETHVADVVALLTDEDLHDVVLVGHSGANIVVDSVADRVPQRIATLVHVDTGPLPDGASVQDFKSPPEQDQDARLIATAGDGWRLPPPRWEELPAPLTAGLGPAELALLAERCTPHPAACLTTPMRRRNPAATADIPKLAVLCTFTVAGTRELAAQAPEVFGPMLGDDWTLVELPTGHWPLLSRPVDLADILDPAIDRGAR